jgi:hypothetical protein
VCVCVCRSLSRSLNVYASICMMSASLSSSLLSVLLSLASSSASSRRCVSSSFSLRCRYGHFRPMRLLFCSSSWPEISFRSEDEREISVDLANASLSSSRAHVRPSQVILRHCVCVWSELFAMCPTVVRRTDRRGKESLTYSPDQPTPVHSLMRAARERCVARS